MALPFILAGAAIAAAGYGAKKGYDGYQKSSSAENITAEFQKRVQRAEESLEKIKQFTHKKLESYGNLQFEASNNFLTFKEIAQTLIEKLDAATDYKVDMPVPAYQLSEIDDFNTSVVKYTGSIAAGAAAGGAAAFATYSGVMAFAAASTGTPIAALSGAAATNATYAAIGGGSLASGGLGIAGGTTILSGVVAAPVVAALGIMYDNMSEKKLDAARKSSQEADKYVATALKARDMQATLGNYVENLLCNVRVLHCSFVEKYLEPLQAMNTLVRSGQDISQFSDNIITLVGNGFKLAAIITDIFTTPLFKVKKDEQGNVEKDEEGKIILELDSNDQPVANTKEINEVLLQSNISAESLI